MSIILINSVKIKVTLPKMVALDYEGKYAKIIIIEIITKVFLFY